MFFNRANINEQGGKHAQEYADAGHYVDHVMNKVRYHFGKNIALTSEVYLISSYGDILYIFKTLTRINLLYLNSKI